MHGVLAPSVIRDEIEEEWQFSIRPQKKSRAKESIFFLDRIENR